MKIGDVVHARDIFWINHIETHQDVRHFMQPRMRQWMKCTLFIRSYRDRLSRQLWRISGQLFKEWAKAPDDSVQQNLVIQKANLFVSRSNAVYTGLPTPEYDQYTDFR